MMQEEKSQIERIQEEQSETIARFDNIFEAWDSNRLKKLDAKAYAAWIASLRFWMVFLTLTFKEETPYDSALKKYRRLVRKLNKSVVGNQYTKFVKHSYFSYILGIEYQRRDVIHFHVLIDKPVPFQLIHNYWNDLAGYAWAEKTYNHTDVVRYVTKYISKGGEIIPYLAKKDYQPNLLPFWWETESIQD
jgi:hypothetical protein